MYPDDPNKPVCSCGPRYDNCEHRFFDNTPHCTGDCPTYVLCRFCNRDKIAIKWKSRYTSQGSTMTPAIPLHVPGHKVTCVLSVSNRDHYNPDLQITRLRLELDCKDRRVMVNKTFPTLKEAEKYANIAVDMIYAGDTWVISNECCN